MSVIHEFPKNNREVVRATLGEIDGRRVAALWVFASTTTGMVPTKKGLSVSVDALPELEEAVRHLRAAVAAEAPR